MAERAEKDRLRTLGFWIALQRQEFTFTGFGIFRQFPSDLFQEASVAGAEKAVIVHLVEASGENMLEEATYELRCLSGTLGNLYS